MIQDYDKVLNTPKGRDRVSLGGCLVWRRYYITRVWRRYYIARVCVAITVLVRMNMLWFQWFEIIDIPIERLILWLQSYYIRQVKFNCMLLGPRMSKRAGGADSLCVHRLVNFKENNLFVNKKRQRKTGIAVRWSIGTLGISGRSNLLLTSVRGP